MDTRNTPATQEWLNKWDLEIPNIFSKGETEYLIFLCNQHRTITLVLNHRNISNKYFKLSNIEGKFLEIDISPELMHELSKVPTPHSGFEGGLGFILNWIRI